MSKRCCKSSALGRSVKKVRHSSTLASIEKLSTDLLRDIFCRLPSCESVCLCKCVCRRWNSIISEPEFVARYLSQCTSVLKSAHTKKPLTFMLTLKRDISESCGPCPSRIAFLTSSDRLFDMHPYNFSFFRFLPNVIQIAATYKDLVLCYGMDQSSSIRQRVYYICNPLTSRWVALPPSPLLPRVEQSSSAALVFKEEHDLHSIYCADRLFRVVVVVHPHPEDLYEEFNLVVFLSEVGQWKEIALTVPAPMWTLFPKSDCFHPFQSIVVRGLLYLRHNLKFGVFDPFKITALHNSSDFIARNLPFPHLPGVPASTMVESQGQLHAMWHERWFLDIRRLEYLEEVNPADENELNDNSSHLNKVTPKWNLLCRKATNFAMKSLIPSLKVAHRAIGMHPHDRNLIYILVGKDQLFSFDWGSRHFEALNDLNGYAWLPWRKWEEVHRLELQCWPTPVP